MNNPWVDIDSPANDLSARRVDHKHPLDLFWARDHIGNYLFVYEFSTHVESLPDTLPDLAGIQALFLSGRDDSESDRLVLMLKDRGKWEIFLSLCNDLIQATRNCSNDSAAVDTLLRRLSHWHAFLKRVRPDILPEEQIKGLIGELLFIREHLMPAFGLNQAIKFWQGPEGLPQDFNINNSAIEVKCQSGSTPARVWITSAEQLCPQLPEMYLFVVTLGKTTPDNKTAINLPFLINYFRVELEMDGSGIIERFNDLLHMIGYVDSELYLDFSYVLADQRMFEVSDDFPRICPENIHPGIDRLTYSINLPECEPFRKCPEWMEV